MWKRKKGCRCWRRKEEKREKSTRPNKTQDIGKMKKKRRKETIKER